MLTYVLSKVWLAGLGMGIYAAGILYMHRTYDFHPGVPLEALLSFAVGMMLGVRVSKCYDRWWEARTQWGKLVNISRKLATKMKLYSGADDSERRVIHKLIQGFARSLKNHLRGGAPLQEVRGFVIDPAEPVHVPAYLSDRIYSLFEEWREAGRITEIQALLLDEEATNLLEVAGACERINGTPMPPSFRAFVRATIWLLLLTLPWELASAVGWISVPAMVLATYLAAGGEAIAHQMERPFGIYFDDLDLEAYCNGIDRVVAEILKVPSLQD